MENGKVKLGIIGCGWIVEHAHIPAIRSCENAEISVILDTDESRAKEIASKYNIPDFCWEIEDFWLKDIDAVIVATPNYTHADYCLQAVERGVHVLCEKPIALHKKDIYTILQKAVENNVIYVPGFVNRWRMDISAALDIVKRGDIGRVKHVSGGWIRNCGIPRPGTWFTDKSLSGGGVLVDLGSHVIDICSLFVGEGRLKNCDLLYKPCEQKEYEGNSANWFVRECENHGVINVEEAAIANILFDDKLSMEVKVSWCADTEGDATYFTICGEQGTIEIKTLFGFSNQRLWENDSLKLLKGEEVFDYSIPRFDNNTTGAFGKMMNYFIDSVRNNGNEAVDYNSLVAEVELIERLYEKQHLDDGSLGIRLKEAL